MAALIRHGSYASAFKSTSAILVNSTVIARRDAARYKSHKSHKGHKAHKTSKVEVKARFDSSRESLAARGFLRPLKPYQPPEDATEKINKICESQTISQNDDAKLEDLSDRFKLFVACEKEFKYSIPNSLLYTIESIGDLKRFYSTPVDIATPYEALSKADLPKNLHIQQDYVRFHPDTDTMFGGKTAFPNSSTIVTGLKYKKKYPGHKQEDPWLDEMMKI